MAMAMVTVTAMVTVMAGNPDKGLLNQVFVSRQL